jgi:hypothetical protein
LSKGWLDIDSDIVDFLKISYPKNEIILIGCRIGKYLSYECCEYNVIVLDASRRNKFGIKEKSLLLHLNKKKLEISFYDTDTFKNSNFVFLDYINLTNAFFKSDAENFVENKKRFNKTNIKLFTKRNLLKQALDIVQINKEISLGKLDENLSSFYSKIISFQIVELLLQLYLNEIPSPSHLKYQINTIRESSLKIREPLELLLDILDIDQSNVSSIERSIKSLLFFIKNNKSNNLSLDLLNAKLDYFKKKSMYVDADLLIHCFIKNQYFDKNYIKSYNKILKHILNIKNKDMVFISKELELIFKILKNLIENSY